MKEEIPTFRYIKFNFIIILVCGLISIIVGICMNINNEFATGFSRRRFISFNGSAAIILGILISIYPSFLLLKNYFKKNTS